MRREDERPTFSRLVGEFNGLMDSTRWEMTPEQEKLQADLIAQYGEAIVRQARELSGLTMCMLALGSDELSSEERAKAYQQASVHLAAFVETMMSSSQSAKVTECAKRLDAALDTWMADEIEKRDGLPPL